MAGRRTSLVCYNQPLQDWLKAAGSASFADDLVVLNYHSLASAHCWEAGVQLWERRPPVVGAQKGRQGRSGPAVVPA